MPADKPRRAVPREWACGSGGHVFGLIGRGEEKGITTGKLTAKQVENAGPGMHADGNGLYLQVTSGNAWSWVYHARRARAVWRPGWRWLRCDRRRASALAAPAAAGWIRRTAGRLRQLPACRRDTPDAGALVFRGFNCHTVRCVSPRIVARAAAPLQPQASKLTMSLQRDSEEAPHTRPQQPHRARRLHVDVNQAQQGSRASAAALDGRH
jgi:hypothetical protein